MHFFEDLEIGRRRDFDIERQFVIRAKRHQPAQLVDPRRAEGRSAADKAVEHHPHHDRAKMPARAREALEHRSGCRLFVEMHRLRIEFGGKAKDLLAGNPARTKCPEMTGRKIFKAEHHDEDCRKEGLIVAVICGNLNRPTRMTRAIWASTVFRCFCLTCPGQRSELGRVLSAATPIVNPLT